MLSFRRFDVRFRRFPVFSLMIFRAFIFCIYTNKPKNENKYTKYKYHNEKLRGPIFRRVSPPATTMWLWHAVTLHDFIT
jgi:hypothetical protein